MICTRFLFLNFFNLMYSPYPGRRAASCAVCSPCTNSALQGSLLHPSPYKPSPTTGKHSSWQRANGGRPTRVITLRLWLAISYFFSLLKERSVITAVFQMLLGHCSFVIDVDWPKPSLLLEKTPQMSFLHGQNTFKHPKCWATSYGNLLCPERKGYKSHSSAGTNEIQKKKRDVVMLMKYKFNSHLWMTLCKITPVTSYVGLSDWLPLAKLASLVPPFCHRTIESQNA